MIRPKTPQAAITARSPQRNPFPVGEKYAACMASAKWRTGKILPTTSPHGGAFAVTGMKMSDRNRIGRIEAFTIAGAASAFGMIVVMARPRAAKLAAPTRIVTMNAGNVLALRVAE